MTSVLSDHPRIRGEHPVRARPSAMRGGSSPHTRGAPFGGHRLVGGGWIIPAYAGSTVPASLVSSFGKDHPRIRGEHSSWSIFAS